MESDVRNRGPVSLYCGSNYVPYQQLNGSWIPLLQSRSLCGPTRAVYDVNYYWQIQFAYQVGFGRCVALNVTPSISGNAFVLLGRFAMNWYQAASFCENRGWYYVRVI